MRQLPVSAGLAALLLAAVPPASAQESGDCGVMCRLQGYLSTDHMTSDAEAAPAGAPAKPHRTHAAAHKPALPVVSPKPALASGSPAHKPAPVARATVEPPAPQHDAVRGPAAVPPRTAAARPPSKHPARVAAVPPAPVAKPARPSLTRPSETAAATPVLPRVATRPAPRPALARIAPPATPTRTASLSTAIPGSAPAVQAGFH